MHRSLRHLDADGAPPSCGPISRKADPLRYRQRRAGAATLWLILVLPLLLILLFTIAEVGNLVLARQQLKNSLDAAATSAALRWGQDGGNDTLAARDFGVAIGGLNYYANSQPLVLNSNYDVSNTNPNQNNNLTGADANLIFGLVTGPEDDLLLDADADVNASATSAQIIAFGNFGNGNTNDDFLRVEFSTSMPTTTVIRELWIDLRAGTDPGNDAVFVYPPTNWGVQTSSGAPSFTGTITFHTAMPPTGGNQVTANAPVIRVVFPATSFTAGNAPARFWQQAGLRIANLGVGVGNGGTNNKGDAFGIYDVEGRLVTQDVPPGGVLSTTPFTFQDTGGVDGIAQESVNFAGGSSRLGVRAAMEVQVPSLSGTLFGLTLPTHTVRAESTAAYDRSLTPGQVRVVRIQRYDPPAISASP